MCKIKQLAPTTNISILSHSYLVHLLFSVLKWFSSKLILLLSIGYRSQIFDGLFSVADPDTYLLLVQEVDVVMKKWKCNLSRAAERVGKNKRVLYRFRYIHHLAVTNMLLLQMVSNKINITYISSYKMTATPVVTSGVVFIPNCSSGVTIFSFIII